MLYALAADAVLLLHGAFIVFAVLGGLLVRWRRHMAAVHLPAAGWAAAISFTGGVCPLTPLENALRLRAGEATYPGAFIEEYLLRLIYPPGLTTAVQLALGILVIAVNVAIYGWALRAWRR